MNKRDLSLFGERPVTTRNKFLTFTAVLLAALLPEGVSTLAAPVGVSFKESGLASVQVNGQERLMASGPSLWRGKLESGATLNLKAVSVAFDQATRIATTQYDWGNVQSTFEPLPDGVRLRVTVANKGPESISELGFNLLQLAAPDQDAKVSRSTFGLEGPPIVLASGSAGSIAYAREEDGKPLGMDLQSGTAGRDKTPVINVRAHLGGDRVILDNVTAARPIAAGSTDSFTVTLHFGTPQESPVNLAHGAIDAYRKAHPQKLNWPERGPILRVFWGGGLPKEQANANLKNPDQVVPAAPDEKFRSFVLGRARSTVEAAKAVHAQGVIMWDLEGGTFPHAITYIGDPRLVRVLNPQMDAVIDDAMKVLRDAGLRTGITLRPSHVVYDEKKGTATHRHTGEDPFQQLDAKVAYAKQRWGATIFYVDTNFFWRPYGEKQEWQSGQLTPQLWEKLLAKYPDTLFIPEFGNPADYAFTAPYGEADMGQYSTPELVRAIYPDSWRVLVMEDADPYQNFDRFVQAVREGNALMTYAFSPDAPNVVATARIQRQSALLSAPIPTSVAIAKADALPALLASPDAAVRFHAARRLGENAAPGAADALLKRMQDSNEEYSVRRAAVLALAKNPSVPAIPALADLVLDKKSGMYAAAATALASQGQPAFEPLLERLQSEATSPRGTAANLELLKDAIVAIQGAALAPRIEALVPKVPAEPKQHFAPRQRVLVGLIGQLRNPQSEDFLMAAVESPALREVAALGLAGMGSEAASTKVKQVIDEERKAGRMEQANRLSRALQERK